MALLPFRVGVGLGVAGRGDGKRRSWAACETGIVERDGEVGLGPTDLVAHETND